MKISVCEWFIAYILPLFCDVSLLDSVTLGNIRVLFAIVVAIVWINLLIVIPYKWVKKLFTGGRKL